MSILLATASDGATRTVVLDGESLTLGRVCDGPLCFPEDPGLSRRHCLFERQGDQWAVSDMGSKNGTLVNGTKIAGKHPLRPGDRVRASHVEVTFDAAPAAGHTVVFEASHFVDSTIAGGMRTSLREIQSEAASANARWRTPMQALIRAGRELVVSRPLSEFFPVILTLSMEAVGAERGVLFTLEEGQLMPQTSSGGEFHISTTVRDKVMQERVSLLVQNVLDDQVLRERQSVVIGGMRSLMAVPLQTDERAIGLLYVDSCRSDRPFSRDELNLLTVMANVAAMRIERARLAQVEEAEKFLERELEQAAEIQRRHLPTSPPVISGLDLAGHNCPCRTVGGDYYDYLVLPDDRVVVLVADVAGKGLSAALMMMNLQARVQVMTCDPDDIAGLMGRLNRSISVACPGNRFITMFFCVLDPRNGQMTYCNAGHNPPFLIRSNGDVERLDTGGPVLGLSLKIPYRQERREMAPGDLLALFSDGVSEAENPSGEEFGEERLAAVFGQNRERPAKAVIESVCHAVEEWRASAPVADDATLVVARRVG